MAIRGRRWLWTAGAVTVALLLVMLLRTRSTPTDPRSVLRDSIAVLRTAADSCRAAVVAGVAELNDYDARVDAMRERVRELEALHPRGVPVDSYDVYMSAFNRYNDSAAAWPALADTVRAADARCRAVAQRHNAFTDSLRRLIIPPPDPAYQPSPDPAYQR